MSQSVVRAFAMAGAAYYLALGLAHGVVLGPLLAGTMAAVSLATATLYGWAAWRLGASRSVLETEALALALFLTAIGNVLTHGLLARDSALSGYLPVMAMGFALLAPSTRTMALALAAFAAAAAVFSGQGLLPNPSHSWFVLGSTTFAGAVTATCLRGAMRELHRARCEADRLRLDANRWALELEEKVKARTAALAAKTEQAERALASRTDFLAAMSHELRTPVHAILGYAGLLKEAVAADAQAVADLDRIETASSRLQAMIDDLLHAGGIERRHL